MQNHLDNRVCAGFFVRAAAFLLDSAIIGLVVGIAGLPFLFVSADSFLRSNFIFQYTVLDVLRYLAVSAYFVLLTYFAHTTPGKLLLGLEVITVDREYSFVNILYRETVGRFLSSLLCIGYLAVLGTKYHQGFHDMLCDTCVVYKNMMPALRPSPAGQGNPPDSGRVEPVPEGEIPSEETAPGNSRTTSLEGEGENGQGESRSDVLFQQEAEAPERQPDVISQPEGPLGDRQAVPPSREGKAPVYYPVHEEDSSGG